MAAKSKQIQLKRFLFLGPTGAGKSDDHTKYIRLIF